MEKYVIVSILDTEFPKEFQYVDWPLHTTLLRPFKTNVASHELADRLQNICMKQPILVSEGKSKELFGPECNVPVTELINTPELQNLHEVIKSAYIKDIEFTAPQHPDFRPHVTENKGRGVQVGEQVHIRSLSLVELSPEGHKVLNTFPLK